MWQMRTLTVLVACCAGGLLPASRSLSPSA